MQYKGALYGKVGRRYFSLKVTADQVDVLAFWARNLKDIQNGPPLVRDTADWNSAMDGLEKALEPLEANAAGEASLDPLVGRWSPAQIERAAEIVNDIAEDIDNRESRHELRQALACYADQIMILRESREMTRTDKLIAEIEKLTALMSHNAESEV